MESIKKIERYAIIDKLYMNKKDLQKYRIIN